MPFKSHQIQFAFEQAIKEAAAQGKLGAHSLNTFYGDPHCSIAHGAVALGVKLPTYRQDTNDGMRFCINLAEASGLTLEEQSSIVRANDRSLAADRLEAVLAITREIGVVEG